MSSASPDFESMVAARRRSIKGVMPSGFYCALSKRIKDKRTKKPVRGLFTDHLIRKGEWVGTYDGELICECKYDEEHRDSCYYFEMTWDLPEHKEYLIDSSDNKKSTFTRYINSPDRLRDANCAYEQRCRTVFVRALRDIQPHTELLADYGPDHDDIIDMH